MAKTTHIYLQISMKKITFPNDMGKIPTNYGKNSLK